MAQEIKRFDDLTIRRLFGSEDAESEDSERFKEYFVRNRAYEDLCTPLPLRILVGHKGVGKSALLRHAYDVDIDEGRLAIFLRPDDLSKLLQSAGELDINLRIEAWKNGIRRRIAEKAVEFFTQGAIGSLENSQISGVGKKISSVVLSTVKAFKPDISEGAEKVIYDNFCRTPEVHVYIDDIDRGWSARPQDILNISAMINALRDMANSDSNFRCRIALRTDVYFLVRTSDESTDKIEQDVIRLSWENDEILRLMANRISTYLELEFDYSEIQKMPQSEITNKILSCIVEPRFHGRGKWSNRATHTVLLSLCRARPRDLIKLLYGAAKEAARNNRNVITTQDMIESFPKYSEERLQDLFNEFKSEVSNIEQFIMQFRPTKYQKTTAENFSRLSP